MSSRDKKNNASSFKRPKPLNLTGCWLMARGYYTEICMTFWYWGHVRSRDKWKAIYPHAWRPRLPNWTGLWLIIEGYRTKSYMVLWSSGQVRSHDKWGKWWFMIRGKVKWPFDHNVTCSHMKNKKRCICNSKKTIGTKRDWVLAYGKRILSKKCMVRGSCGQVSSRDMRSDISRRPRRLGPPNLTEQWLMTMTTTQKVA